MPEERSVSRAAAALAVAALLLTASTSLAWLDPAAPGVVTVVTTGDNQFDFYDGPGNQLEWKFTHGATQQLRLKGSQNISGFQFNLSAYAGQTVQEAELHLCRSNTDPINSLVAATINTAWVESGASYRYRAAPYYEWTYLNSDLSTATFGNHGSLVSFGYLLHDTFKIYASAGQTWIAMKLDPDLVNALIVDQPGGLIVADPRGHTGLNPTVYSREASSGAYAARLYIKFNSTPDTTPPGAVTGLTAANGARNGEVILTFNAPSDPQAPKAFGYDIRYSMSNNFNSATPVARWMIPRPKLPGTQQKVMIDNMYTGYTFYFFVRAYDAAGNPGPIASTSVQTTPWTDPPALIDGPLAAPNPVGKSILSVPGIMRYWATSELTKVHPMTGNRMEDGYTSGTLFEDYKKANVIWDSAANTIFLAGCRNEMIGAQLILERLGASLDNVSVTVSNLTGPAGATIPANPYIELFQLHYVKAMNQGTGAYLGYRVPEVAIPLFSPFATTFNIPDPNRNPAGMNQAVWMDLYVPKTAAPGEYKGTVTLTAAQLATPVTINLKVRIYRPTIPDDPSFIVDLNGYGNPWDWGSVYFTTLRYFQLCHKHRAVCNTVPYGWNGLNSSDRVPVCTTGADRHVDNWITFDNKYARFFNTNTALEQTAPSKLAFSTVNPDGPYYGPGINTPVTHFYASFNEMWPMSLIDANYGFDPINNPLPGLPGLGGTYWNNIQASDPNYFWLNAPDTWLAFPEPYKQSNRNIIAEWMQHAQASGWTKTAFECYLNNKYSYGNCYALWVLEECETADDFRAVGFYHQLYRDGQAASNAPDAKWHFRIDISDRFGQNWGQLDNRINWHVMGAGAAGWHFRGKEYRKYHLDPDKPEDWLWYGLGAAVNQSSLQNVQAFLQKWCQGFVGGVPYWSCYNMTWQDNYNANHNSWTDGSDLALIYRGDTTPGGPNYSGALASIRVKSLRCVQQVIELLNYWAKVPRMNRFKVRDALNAKYGSAPDLDTFTFELIDEFSVFKMRADLIAQLDADLFLKADINGDTRVNVFDLQRLGASWNKQSGQAGYDPACDLNGDNRVNVFDLQILGSQWNTSKPLP